MQQLEQLFIELRFATMGNFVHESSDPSIPPSHCSLPPNPISTNQQAATIAVTRSHPSPLNNRFLLPSGDYNPAATGTLVEATSALYASVPIRQQN